MEPNNRNNRNRGDKNRRRGGGMWSIVLWALLLTIGVNYLSVMLDQARTAESSCEIAYSELVELVEEGKVKSIEFGDTVFTITPVDGFTYTDDDGKSYDQNYTLFTTIIPDATEKLITLCDKHGVTYTKPYQPPVSPILTFMVSYILPTVLMVGAFMLLMNFIAKKSGGMGGIGGIGNVGKANAKVYMEKSTGVTFADVAGQDEAKESLVEIIDFLHNPEKYTAIGAKIPKGALLVGSPGTGKTLLAKAVAGEAKVPFFSISGSDFVEMFVGVGASRVRDLFAEASKVAPCIIFIDEIDTIGKSRDGGRYGGGNDEREQTLNQLLVEMDGFTNNEGVIVMAATNRADILDNALLRPGRFDRRVYMGLPDIKGREEILKVHARGKPLGDDVDLKSIARGTAGFAGADLENLLNEAAIMATRSKRRFIMQADIDEAILKVVMGPEKKSRVVSERARRLTAYHESGHAIASFFLKNADPVHYITIIPRGAAGGFTWYRKAEDAEDFTSRGEMFDSIVSALGGRIAEQLFLEDISTGASGDIQQATNIARDMVMKYGMSEKLGPISFDDSSHSIFIGRDFGTTKSYSEETAATIDEEVKHIFDQAYAKCEALLREHADLLTGLAEYLLIHETIEGDDFRYYCEHGVMPVHPDDTIEPPAKVIRRMDEAPEAPQPDTEPPAQPTDGAAPEDGSDKTE